MSPETEEIIYTDDFFRCKNIVVNALDNVEARRYVDRLLKFVDNNEILEQLVRKSVASSLTFFALYTF